MDPLTLIATKILEWGVAHMPNLIIRKLFPVAKIREDVRLSLSGKIPFCCVSEDRPGSLQGIELVIDNHNLFPLAVTKLECTLYRVHEPILRNLCLPIRQEAKAHSHTNATVTFDLPDAQKRVIRNHPGDSILLSLKGNLIITAIGQQIACPKEIPFMATIQRDI